MSSPVYIVPRLRTKSKPKELDPKEMDNDVSFPGLIRSTCTTKKDVISFGRFLKEEVVTPPPVKEEHKILVQHPLCKLIVCDMTNSMYVYSRFIKGEDIKDEYPEKILSPVLPRVLEYCEDDESVISSEDDGTEDECPV